MDASKLPEALRRELCAYYARLMHLYPEFMCDKKQQAFAQGTATDDELWLAHRRLRSCQAKAAIVMGVHPRGKTAIVRGTEPSSFNFLIPEPVRSMVEWAHEHHKPWPLSHRDAAEYEQHVTRLLSSSRQRRAWMGDSDSDEWRWQCAAAVAVSAALATTTNPAVVKL